MIRRYPTKLCAALCSAVSLSASAPGFAADGSLPLTRVRLYETGVGYFERSGQLQKGSTLPIPAGHLDDALKTLVVLGNDKTNVSAISLDSRVSRSMGRALAGLEKSGDQSLSYAHLLSSLKGAQVSLRAGSATHRGRLIDIVTGSESADTECAPANKDDSAARGCQLQQFANALLLSRAGALLRVRLSEIDSVTPQDMALNDRLHAALDAMSPRGARAKQPLRVHAPSNATLSIGYVAETPVWRSTYRLMLGEGRRSRLQGWGLIHNDTDEAWQSVQIELVNGQPDSFLFPLAAPRYAHRELLTPPRELSTLPQLLDRTVDNLWLDGYDGLGLSGIGEGGGGQGFGAGHGRLGGSHRSTGPSSSSLLRLGSLAGTSGAVGIEAEALFLYALSAKTGLGARSSALVPFLTESVSSVPVSWFEGNTTSARSAVKLTNDTPQTLPAGAISVFAAGGFAGEALLDRLKPGESTILQYGVDLDLTLVVATQSSSELPQLIEYDGTTLTEHFIRKRVVRYTLQNKSGSARLAHIAIVALDNAKVEGADKVGFDQGRSRAYAAFSVQPRGVMVRRVQIAEGIARNHSKLSPELLRRLAGASGIKQQVRSTLRRAAELLHRAELRERQAQKTEALLHTLKGNIARLREDVKSLRGTKAAEEMGQRMLESERRVEPLEAKARRLSADGREQQAQARALLLTT